MSSSRREFLKRGTWMTLLAGVPLGLSENVLGLGAARGSAAAGLNKAAFESQLNTEFLLNQGAAKVAVTLVDVTNLASETERCRQRHLPDAGEARGVLS